MPLTLIKEDGTGKVDANSYADVADADAYHAGHLYATAWKAATADQKAVALVMATRLIDAEYQFGGVKTMDSQALLWPRYRCVDPDRDPMVRVGRLTIWENWVPENLVPKNVMAATCEMARELLIADRTASPAGEGLDTVSATHATHASSGTGSDSTSSTTKYSKSDTRPVISRVAQAMLSKYGALVDGGSGAVRLTRA